MAAEYRIRPVEEGDLPVFFAHQTDPQGAHLAAFASRDEQAFYTHWRRIMSDPTVTMRTIVNGTTVIGNIVAFNMGEVREVGYWLGREYWGRGAATTALCDFLKVERQRPLHATVASHNIGSIRVLQKCGFARISQFVGETGTLMQVFLLEEVG